MNTLILCSTLKNLSSNPSRIARVALSNVKKIKTPFQRWNSSSPKPPEMVTIALGDNNVRLGYSCRYREGDDIRRVPDKVTRKLYVPAYVAYSPYKGILVGEDALAQQAYNPENTIFGLRQLLGNTYETVKANKKFKDAPFEIVPNPTDPEEVLVRFGPDLVSPKKLVAVLFQRLYENVQRHLRHPVQDAVLVAPARSCQTEAEELQDLKRIGALQEAACQANFKPVRVIRDTTALGFYHEFELKSDTSFAHVHIGGSESRVSFAKHLFGGKFEIASNSKIINFGGNDIDEAIAEHFKSSVLRNVEISPSTKEWFYLLESCKKLKEDLSSHSSATCNVEIRRTNYVLSLDRTAFENLLANFTSQLKDALKKFPVPNTWKNMQLENIVVSGGSAHIPYIQDKIFAAVPCTRFIVTPNPETILSVGAAKFACYYAQYYALEKTIAQTPNFQSKDEVKGIDQGHSISLVPHYVQSKTIGGCGEIFYDGIEVGEKDMQH